MITKITKNINGVDYTLETGRLANLAHSAVLATAGETVVLTTISIGTENPDLDFFPLSVDYVEKLYAAGMISSSKFMKREGRPTDKEILASRLIDRSIRSLFPENLVREVQVISQVLSYDKENSPEILQCLAASTALMISGIPFEGPVMTVRSGYVDGEIIYMPSDKQMKNSNMNLIVSVTHDSVVSIEAEAKIIPEDILSNVLKMSLEKGRPFLELQKEFAASTGIKEFSYNPRVIAEELLEKLRFDIKDFLNEAAFIKDKKSRNLAINTKRDEIHLKYDIDYKSSDVNKGFENILKDVIRRSALDHNKRIDGRALDELRPISAEVGVLPRVHGSAIFNRGETQVMSIVTLASSSLEQLVENIEGDDSKRYMHHYNFPGYSVGEVDRKFGMANRRAIGHGMIGEKSLLQVLPSSDKFKYTIRVVSEVLSSNGSTSMAATCGSTLALMDAGVQISNPIAGISIGLVYENLSKYVLFTDIIGDEDHFGDMDFKITGTKEGWTAIQLDNKLKGIPVDILIEAVVQSKKIRLDILNYMDTVISEPRKDFSQYAPRIVSIKINPSKIGELIGPGGKVIKEIIAQTGTEIDIEENGTVNISSISSDAANKAIALIKSTLNEIEIGTILSATIKRVEAYGAFIEVSKNLSGLVHVSKMPEGFLKSLKMGENVQVRYDGTDEQGRHNFSIPLNQKAI